MVFWLDRLFKSSNTFVSIKVMWALVEFLTTMCMGKLVSMLTSETHYITLLALIYFSTTIFISKCVKLTIAEFTNRIILIFLVVIWLFMFVFIHTAPIWSAYLVIMFMALADLCFRPWISLLIDKLPLQKDKTKVVARTNVSVGVFGALAFFSGSYILKGYQDIQFFLLVAIILAVIVYVFLVSGHKINDSGVYANVKKSNKSVPSDAQADFKIGYLFLLFFLFQVLYKSTDGVNVFYVLDRIGENKEYQFRFVALYFVGYTLAPFIYTRFIYEGRYKKMVGMFFISMLLYYISVLLSVPFLYLYMALLGVGNSMFGLYINSTMYKHFSGISLVRTLNTFYRYSASGPLLATLSINIIGWSSSDYIFSYYVPFLLLLAVVGVFFTIRVRFS